MIGELGRIDGCSFTEGRIFVSWRLEDEIGRLTYTFAIAREVAWVDTVRAALMTARCTSSFHSVSCALFSSKDMAEATISWTSASGTIFPVFRRLFGSLAHGYRKRIRSLGCNAPKLGSVKLATSSGCERIQSAAAPAGGVEDVQIPGMLGCQFHLRVLGHGCRAGGRRLGSAPEWLRSRNK